VDEKHPLRPAHSLSRGPAALAFLYVREWFAVGSALDAGASWNYVAGRADFHQNHPFVPFAERHDTFIAVAVWSLAATAVYLGWFGNIFRRSDAG